MAGRKNVLGQAKQNDRNVHHGRKIYFNAGNIALANAHLGRKYIFSSGVSNEISKCAALIRE